MPYMGPTVGCAKGCLNYWFCCKGARALFCARKVRSFERPAKGCCAGCMP